MCAARMQPPLHLYGDDDESSSVDSPSDDEDGRLSHLAPVVDATDDAAGPPSSDVLVPVAEAEQQQSPPLMATTSMVCPTVEAATDSTPLPGPSQLSREHSYQLQSRILRPPNAFLLFAQEKRPLVAAANPNDDSQRVNMKLGELWRSLEEAEKQRYRHQASQAAKEHRKKYPDYVYNPFEARMRKDQEGKVKEIIAEFKKGTSTAKRRTTPVKKRCRVPAKDREQRGSQPRRRRLIVKKTPRRATKSSAGASQSATSGQKSTAVVEAVPSSSSAPPCETLAHHEREQRGSSGAMPPPVPSSQEMIVSAAGVVLEETLWTPVVDHLRTPMAWSGDFNAIPLFFPVASSSGFPGAPPAPPLLVPPLPAAVDAPQVPQTTLQAQFSAPPAPTLPARYDAATTLPSAADLQWPQLAMVQAALEPMGPLTPYDGGHHGTAVGTPHSGTFDAMTAPSSYCQQLAVVPQTTVVPNEATPATPLQLQATQQDPELNFNSSDSQAWPEALVSAGDPVMGRAQWLTFTPLGQHGVSGSRRGAGTTANSQQPLPMPYLPPSALYEPGPVATTTSGYAARKPEQVVPPHQMGYEPMRVPQPEENRLEQPTLESSSSPPLGLDEIVNYILSLDQPDRS